MATFSKRHYEKIATELRWQTTAIRPDGIKQFCWTVEQLSEMFANDNSKFNKDKFLIAIYGKGGALQ